MVILGRNLEREKLGLRYKYKINYLFRNKKLEKIIYRASMKI